MIDEFASSIVDVVRDTYLQVTDEESIQVARRLAKEEGIFAGFSSGANVAADLQLLRTTCRGKTIAVLLSDSGLKYLIPEPDDDSLFSPHPLPLLPLGEGHFLWRLPPPPHFFQERFIRFWY